MTEVNMFRNNKNGIAAFDEALFKNPTPQFFPMYAWVWNDELSKTEIISQIDSFDSAGIKGIYVIPQPKEFRPETQKTFLSPDYLSKEYMEYLRFAYDYAEKKGICLWLYDEAGWPSGGACGIVKKKYPKASPRGITARKICLSAGEEYRAKSDVLSAFSGGVRVFDGFMAEDKTTVTEYFAKEFTQNCNFANLLDEKVVDIFLDVTYGAYEKYLSGPLGRSISLVFTDEPRLQMPAWHDGLDVKFRERYGYDLLDFLPAVTDGKSEKSSEQARARIDYLELCASEIKRVFFDKCAERCKKTDGLYYGGHVGGEDIPNKAATCGYGSLLSPLRTMDIPGIDTIWRQIFPFKDGNPTPEGHRFFPRIAPSAASESGGELALSESFSVYGDGLTPDEMRYVVNFQLLRGINVFNFMSIPYGKRRALALCMRPAVISEKPGFLNMKGFGEAVARSEVISQTGKRCCDTALYFPSNAFAVGGKVSEKAEKSYVAIGEALERELIDFDIIDDYAIRNAKVNEKSGTLCIGNASYSHIVIPDADYIPSDVLQIARRFGGKGTPLASCDSQDIRISSRSLDGGRIYIVFNEGIRPVKAKISFPDKRKCFRPDTASGFVYGEKSNTVTASLQSGEIAFYLFTDKETEVFDETRLCELPLENPRFVCANRFVISVDGVANSPAAESEIGGADFSGEVTLEYDFKLPEGERADRIYVISPNLVNRTVRAYFGDKLLGTCAETPQKIYVPSGILPQSGKLLLTVANTAANEISAKEHSVFDLWDKAEYNSYHPKTALYEKDSLFTVMD